MPPPKPERKLVCLAAVAAAHGVRGALRLRCFTEAPDSVAAYGPVHDERGRELFELTILGSVAGGVIVRAPGIDDRNAAEALRGKRLYVPRDRLPALGDADEFYHDDLLGLSAVDGDGRAVGRVVAVHDFGAGDLLELELAAGERLILPFSREVVPAIDLAAGRLTVVTPVEIRPGGAGATDGTGGAARAGWLR